MTIREVAECLGRRVISCQECDEELVIFVVTPDNPDGYKLSIDRITFPNEEHNVRIIASPKQ